jgi:hypothetical protein
VNGGAVVGQYISVDGTAIVQGILSVRETLHADESIEFGSNLSITGFDATAKIITPNLVVDGSQVVGGDAIFEHGISVSGPLHSGSGLSINSGGLIIPCLSISSGLVVQSNVSIIGALRFQDVMEMHVGDWNMISATSDGTGFFHGHWTFDTAASTSDRRLKSQITPLGMALKEQAAAQNMTVAEWIIQELRPVSFVLNGNDPTPRYGFIAQDVQGVLPELVRAIGDGKTGDGDTLSVLYQDMIAILTLVVQEHQLEIKNLREEIVQTRRELDDLREMVKGLVASKQENLSV